MFALIKCSNVLLSGLNKRLLAIAIAVERSLAMTADELNEVLHANEGCDDIIQCAVGRFRECLPDFKRAAGNLTWLRDLTLTTQEKDERQSEYEAGYLLAEGVLMARVEDVIKEVQTQSRALVISEFEDVARESTLIGTIDKRINKEEVPIAKSARHVFMTRVEDVIKEVQKQSRALVISEFEDFAGNSTPIGTIDRRIDKEEAPIGESARHVMIALSAVMFLWVVFLW